MFIEATSKNEAKSKGLTHYFTGKPCKHGHLSIRNVSGHCVECRRIDSLCRYSENREKEQARSSKRRELFRSKTRETVRKSQSRLYWKDPERSRAYAGEWKRKNKDKTRLYYENYKAHSSHKINEKTSKEGLQK